MIASNLPDVDVLVFATGTPSVAFRRGWTHGILRDALLPPLLTAVMLFVASRRPTSSRQPSVQADAAPAAVVLGVILHVLMDLLNTYGVRLLMPFSQHWFYGTSSSSSTRGYGSCLDGRLACVRRRAPNWSRASLAVAAAYVSRCWSPRGRLGRR
jgi:membrane-bound metal-dependent hydrolase YbcI (DUF457 family)